MGRLRLTVRVRCGAPAGRVRRDTLTPIAAMSLPYTLKQKR